MTPNGHAATQYAHPLQMSGWTYTLANSLYTIAPVGHACWHGAAAQCLHTSDIISQRFPGGAASAPRGASTTFSAIRPSGFGSTSANCSTNLTCRQLSAV